MLTGLLRQIERSVATLNIEDGKSLGDDCGQDRGREVRRGVKDSELVISDQ